MLTKDQVSKLLNRPLTTAENTNFSTYLKIATERLEELLCFDLCINTPTRTYLVREGYRTVFTDVFNGSVTITIDGETVDTADYTVRQFDNLNGSWFNSIVFKKHLPREVEEIVVEAAWGFNGLPVDLQLLLAKLFALNTQSQTADDRVKSKKIEDFTVSYNDQTTYDQFVMSNADVIRKYSICSMGDIQHGRVYPVYY